VAPKTPFIKYQHLLSLEKERKSKWPLFKNQDNMLY